LQSPLSFCKCKFQLFTSLLIEKMQIEKRSAFPFGFASFHPSVSSPFHSHPVLFTLCFTTMKSHLIISPQLQL
jgi:hypothetical protein